MTYIVRSPYSFEEVPAPIVNPSGGIKNRTVQRGELDDLLAELVDKVGQLRSDLSTRLDQDEQNYTTADTTINNRIDAIQQGVVESYLVAVSIPDIAQARPDLPGLDTNAADYRRRILVWSNEAFSPNSGVWVYQGANLVRDPQFTTTQSLRLGVTFFDDHNNINYRVSQAPSELTPGSGAVGAVQIMPYGRTQDLRTNAATFLTLIGNELNAGLDERYFRVVNGALTFTGSIEDFISTTTGTLSDLAQAIDGINTTVAGINSSLAQIRTRVDNLDTAVQSQGTQITALQGDTQQLSDRLRAAEGDIDNVQAEAERLGTNFQTTTDRVNTVQNQLQATQQAVGQIQTDVTGHTQQLAQQLQRVQNVESQAQTTADTVSGHTQQLQQVNTALSAKLDAAQLDQLEEAKLATLVKTFPLTGGVTEHRPDADDGQMYYFTTFQWATGWGHLRFRAIDLSDAMAPYTKEGDSYVFQRVGVDEAKLVFQSRRAAFPDGECDVTLIRTFPANATPTSPTTNTQQVVIRVNAGGSAIGDWQADTYRGGGFTDSTTNPITNTQYPEVLQSMALGDWMEYTLPIPLDPAGNYLIRLHFAYWNNWNPNNDPRGFNVDCNGFRIISNYNPYELVGSNTAVTHEFTINQEEGFTFVQGEPLRLTFTRNNSSPFINAIEVIKV